MARRVLGNRARRGYTLVEVMITVAILGILSALALPMMSSYIMRSRATEAVGFLAEIKSRQEAYRADFGCYADVSRTYLNLWPNTPPGRSVQNWGSNPDWNTLGAVPPGRKVLFTYSTVAGPPGTTPANRGYPDTRGFNGLDFWFVSLAVGDLDGDRVTMMVESYSHSKGTWTSTGDGVE
jgi:prepilin-type N-terminal cleavage/methylation domain-containing protein